MHGRITVLLAVAALLAGLPSVAGAKGPIKQGTLVLVCEYGGQLQDGARIFVDGHEVGHGASVAVTVMAGPHRVVAGLGTYDGKYWVFEMPVVTVEHKEVRVVRAALEERTPDQAAAVAFALHVFKTHEWKRDVEAMTDDGRIVASASDEEFLLDEIRDDGTVARLRTIRPPGRRIANAVAFSPDGRFLAVNSYIYETLDRIISVWEVSSGARVATFTIRGENIEALAFSPDGRRLAAGFDPPSVRVWNLATEGLVCHVKGLQEINDIHRIVFTPDGRTLMTDGDEYETTVFVEVETGREVRRVPGMVQGLLDDGRLVTYVRDKSTPYEARIHFWSTETGGWLGTASERAFSSPFCPAWPLCVYGGRIYDGRTGELLWATQANAGAVSADGRRLVTDDGIYYLPVRNLRSLAGGT